MKEQMKFELALSLYRHCSVFLFIEITRRQSALIIIIRSSSSPMVSDLKG